MTIRGMRLGGTWAFWLKVGIGIAILIVIVFSYSKLKAIFGGVGKALGSAIDAVASFTPGLHEAGPAEIAATGVTEPVAPEIIPRTIGPAETAAIGVTEPISMFGTVDIQPPVPPPSEPSGPQSPEDFLIWLDTSIQPRLN